MRKGRVSDPGALYFLSAFKAEAAGRLDNEPCFRIIESCMAALELEGVWQWQVYVVMPDHLHMVVRLGNRLTLSRAVQKFKSVTAIEMNRQKGSSGAVWYKGFHDHRIRTTEDISHFFNYIANNPVKKKLAVKPEDYKFLRIKEEYREQARSHIE